MKSIISATALAAIVAAFAMTGHSDYQEAKAQDREYCEMHDIWIKTGGESGWPDFNQNYKEICK